MKVKTLTIYRNLITRILTSLDGSHVTFFQSPQAYIINLKEKYG